MKNKNIILSLVMVVFFGVMSILAWFKPADSFSDAERRKLAQFPDLSLKTVMSGRFMKDFESYTLDQFPLRDGFRSLKANFALHVFNRSANNDIYVLDGHASKMDYPLNTDSVHRAGERFNHVYEKFLKNSDTKVYLSVIPDKNYYMAAQSGALTYDYGKLIEQLKADCGFAKYIDIFDLLELDDYYKTDAHWMQENILPVAEKLAKAMGAPITAEFSKKTIPGDFYGVYYGQSALNLSPDRISYLYSPEMDGYIVHDYQNDKDIPVYNMDKAAGKDPYEMFLSGPLSLVTIENPEAKGNRELVIFRDSFGSSIAPLLASGYNKTTLVDIRYMNPDVLGRYIDFDSQDVLFLYSTGVINNSETIK